MEMEERLPDVQSVRTTFTLRVPCSLDKISLFPFLLQLPPITVINLIRERSWSNMGQTAIAVFHTCLLIKILKIHINLIIQRIFECLFC